VGLHLDQCLEHGVMFGDGDQILLHHLILVDLFLEDLVVGAGQSFDTEHETDEQGEIKGVVGYEIADLYLEESNLVAEVVRFDDTGVITLFFVGQ